MKKTDAMSKQAKRALGTLLWFPLLSAALAAGCSSSEGVGNVLSGLACDAFTIDRDPVCACCSNRPGQCETGVSPCAPKGASPLCGDPCPEGLTCTTVNGQPVCGTESQCVGKTTQACGSCGTQTRTCSEGNWSDWSACAGQGECAPGNIESCGTGRTRVCDATCNYGECTSECASGTTESLSCGLCGTQSRTCSGQGAWGEWSSCSGEGVCPPGNIETCGTGRTRVCDSTCNYGECAAECQSGATESLGCGLCGTQSRSCSGEGAWGEWSSCSGEGACQPGSAESCGSGGGSRVCDSACAWGSCLECQQGRLETRACGTACGAETRTCGQSGTWGEWSSCTASGSCTPGDFQACSGGYQLCTSGCEWSGCITAQCVPGSSATVACGNCGTGTAVCGQNGTYEAPKTCDIQGACAPGTAQECGVDGIQSCTGSCAWGECLPIECSGQQVDTASCGLCGERSRSCVNQRWTAFSGCVDRGVCTPDATESCGTGGTRTCQSSCQWTLCTGQTCEGSFVQSCGVCGIQTRVCNNGTWSSFSPCNGERDCIPGTTEDCGGATSRSCNFQCFWDTCQ